MGDRRGVYRVSVGKPEVKKQFGRPRHRCEDNIKMDLQEVGSEGMAWTNVAQDRDSLGVFVSAGSIKCGKFPY
jgi:hypothetical protein